MEPPSTGKVFVVNESGRRIPRSALSRAVSSVLAHHRLSQHSVCVLVTDDLGVREMNHRFRGLDQATDVLTFPAGDHAGNSLGDIAISREFAERQARARRVSVSQELAYLAIHGALHLAGFDDESEADRALMVAEMNRMAIGAGFKADENWHSIHGGGQ